MDAALTSGMGLPANVATQHERAAGSHFPGAPAAVFNPGPGAASAGMSVFGSKPAGEIMFSESDDHLHHEAVAPVMYPFAVVTDIPSSKLPMMLPKGTIVQIAPLTDDEKINFEKAVRKSDRAGKPLRRLMCDHCKAKSGKGVVGVLAEAAMIRRGREHFNMVTLALENATEVRMNIGVDYTYKAGTTHKLQVGNCDSFRYATVLTGYDHVHNEDVCKVPGGHFCLHPGLFPQGAGTGASFASKSKAKTASKMKKKGKKKRAATNPAMMSATVAAAMAAAEQEAALFF